MSRRGGYTIIDKGRGIIKCHACGKPTRDHDGVGRCSALAGQRIVAAAPPWGRGDGESESAIRRRKYREMNR